MLETLPIASWSGPYAPEMKARQERELLRLYDAARTIGRELLEGLAFEACLAALPKVRAILGPRRVMNIQGVNAEEPAQDGGCKPGVE